MLRSYSGRAELVLMPRPVRPHGLPALAVADVQGELVTERLDGELPVHLPAVGVVDGSATRSSELRLLAACASILGTVVLVIRGAGFW